MKDGGEQRYVPQQREKKGEKRRGEKRLNTELCLSSTIHTSKKGGK